MLSFYHYSHEDQGFRPLAAPEEGAWIHMDGTDLKDLQFLCDLTHLHPADLSDSLDYHELPRMENLQDALLLFIRHPVQQLGHLHTVPLTLVLTPHHLISIAPIASSLMQDMLRKIDVESQSVYKSSKLFIQIIKRILQEFNAQIRKVRNTVMTQNKEMHAVDSDDIFSLTEHEEILNQYLSSLSPLSVSLEMLMKQTIPLFHPKALKEIDDIINGIRQAQELCMILIKNIRSLRDSYQIIFTNKLTRTIKLLTGLTILFSIPTMIASVYGMNVKLPLADDPGAFSFLMIAMVLFSLLCGYLFYHKKWI
ncbi:MAG: hypothetical protein FJZ58_07435 [Chlamydiae bacterium]|nr:hypothetical protein [Chlamydiota bacterium]